MSENKTKATQSNVADFIQSIENEKRRTDALALVDVFGEVTQMQPVIWGSSIVGYGTYHYQTANKKTHQFMRTGFSPRKQNLVLYIMVGFSGFEEKLTSLGKYKTGKSCLYINKLSDVNQDVLKELIALSLEEMQRKYPD